MNGFAACEACLQVYSVETGAYLTIHAEQRSPAMLFSDLHTEKNVRGQRAVHDKPVLSHFECENISCGQQDLKREWKWERKRKTRRPCAANAGVSPCLWHQGLARAGPFLLSEWLRDGWARSLWLLLCVRVSDRAVWAKTKGGVAHSCPETSLWRKSMRELRQQWW